MKHNSKPMVFTLCNQCADVIKEDFNQVITRVDVGQKVLDKCFICGKRGYEYDVRDRETDTVKSKKTVSSDGNSVK